MTVNLNMLGRIMRAQFVASTQWVCIDPSEKEYTDAEEETSEANYLRASRK